MRRDRVSIPAVIVIVAVLALVLTRCGGGAEDQRGGPRRAIGRLVPA